MAVAVVVVVGLAELVEEKGNVQLKQDRGAGEEEESILFFPYDLTKFRVSGGRARGSKDTRRAGLWIRKKRNNKRMSAGKKTYSVTRS